MRCDGEQSSLLPAGLRHFFHGDRLLHFWAFPADKHAAGWQHWHLGTEIGVEDHPVEIGQVDVPWQSPLQPSIAGINCQKRREAFSHAALLGTVMVEMFAAAVIAMNDDDGCALSLTNDAPDQR